jgi:type II secretory pathway component GspD/PulD (secretin)
MPKKLAVLQTREVHAEIDRLLAELRKALGHQVSLECRFLVVGENFLEAVGLDVDFSYNLGGKWGQVTVEQGSALSTQPEPTQVPGSLSGIGPAATLTGGYGSILDDLQVSFLLQMTQAHRDAKSLTAPKVTVLSGESATFSVQRILPLALPPIQQGGGLILNTGGGGGGTTFGGGLQPREMYIPTGSNLTITPTITPDKRNVLLNIITLQNEFLGLRTTELETPIVGQPGQAGGVQEYRIQLPETETSQVMTRVSVPDSGTLLLGGQKITVEIEKEAGVPVLNKIPIIRRLFSNRSKVKDHKILLILVRPVIILQEEREAEAIAAIEQAL